MTLAEFGIIILDMMNMTTAEHAERAADFGFYVIDALSVATHAPVAALPGTIIEGCAELTESIVYAARMAAHHARKALTS